jgi:hypothetical protein
MPARAAAQAVRAHVFEPEQTYIICLADMLKVSRPIIGSSHFSYASNLMSFISELHSMCGHIINFSDTQLAEIHAEVPWGRHHDFEQLLENAIVHLLLHASQLKLIRSLPTSFGP